MPDSTVIVGILSLVGVALGAYATWRSAVRKAEIETEAAPYEVLARRVSDLEAADAAKGRRLASLERKFRLVADALEAQHRWQQDGAVPPPPTISPLAIAAITLQEDQP